MEHTPIPWEVLPGPHAGGLPIMGADRLITEVTGGSSYPEMQANAAFIVRAVNNHDKLLKALEKYEAIHGHSGKCATTDKGCVSEQARDAIQEANK